MPRAHRRAGTSRSLQVTRAESQTRRHDLTGQTVVRIAFGVSGRRQVGGLCWGARGPCEILPAVMMSWAWNEGQQLDTTVWALPWMARPVRQGQRRGDPDGMLLCAPLEAWRRHAALHTARCLAHRGNGVPTPGPRHTRLSRRRLETTGRDRASRVPPVLPTRVPDRSRLRDASAALGSPAARRQEGGAACHVAGAGRPGCPAVPCQAHRMVLSCGTDLAYLLDRGVLRILYSCMEVVL